MKLLRKHDSDVDVELDQAIKQCGMKTHIPASGLPFRPPSTSEQVKAQMEDVMDTISISSIGEGECK